MSVARDSLIALNLRVPRRMLDRVDALRDLVVDAPELAVLPNVTRSDVLRLCVLKGLDVLECQYEDIVDAELAEEADRRLLEAEGEELVPLEDVLRRHGL
jgi:hypothetical protein